MKRKHIPGCFLWEPMRLPDIVSAHVRVSEIDGQAEGISTIEQLLSVLSKSGRV